jgi:hypothetical protein
MTVYFRCIFGDEIAIFFRANDDLTHVNSLVMVLEAFLSIFLLTLRFAFHLRAPMNRFLM